MPETEKKGGKIRVLLADDHAVLRDGLKYLLEAQSDIEVVGTAADGRQAVEQALAIKPHVVVMDISMPILNGIEAARQIREALPATQVIILSMYATREHVYHALQAGSLGYLLKETAGQEVVQAIRSAHAGQRYLSQRISDLVIDDYMQLQQEVRGKSPLEQLTERERQVLKLVVDGLTSAEIAHTLCLSPKTVETYRSRLMLKLGISDIPALVKFAIQQGLTTLE